MFKFWEVWIVLLSALFLSFLPIIQAALWLEVIPEAWTQTDPFATYWRVCCTGVTITTIIFGIIVPCISLVERID